MPVLSPGGLAIQTKGGSLTFGCRAWRPSRALPLAGVPHGHGDPDFLAMFPEGPGKARAEPLEVAGTDPAL